MRRIGRIEFGNPHSLFFIIERIRAMFDLNADWAAIVRSLRTDPMLAERVETDPGLRVPGCWNGFELATRAILGQQITVKGATALAGRIAKQFGRPFSAASGLTHLFPTPEVPYQIRCGRGNDLLFTEPRANRIATLTTSGIVTESPAISRSAPTGITSGVGRRVWFLGSGNNRVYSDVAPENSMANQAARAPSTPTAPSGLHVTVTGN
jgi:hypothetical protein